MSFFEKLIVFLKATGEKPAVFSLYHFMWIAIGIIATTLICIFFKDCKEKTVRRIALISWIITVVFELYKEITYLGYGLVDGKPVWDYDWYGFPFQFCSSTIYLLPFVAFMKDCKAREMIITFLGTFSVFGGLCNYVYPEQVFITSIGMNIQTMVHHGVQIVVGIFFLVHRRKTLSLKRFLESTAVFGVMILIATLLNEVFYYAFIRDLGETFNMFYISRHFECSLPILSMVYPKVPYLVFFLIYTLGFILVAMLIYYIVVGIYKLVKKFIGEKSPT